MGSLPLASGGTREFSQVSAGCFLQGDDRVFEKRPSDTVYTRSVESVYRSADQQCSCPLVEIRVFASLLSLGASPLPQPTSMSDSSLGGAASPLGWNDEVDRPIVAVKFKLVKHQRTVGVAARVPRQREGMEDKVGVPIFLAGGILCFFRMLCSRSCVGKQRHELHAQLGMGLTINFQILS